MKFLVLGCNGMVGHTVGLYLKEQGYDVEGFAREKSDLIKTMVGDARDTELVSRLINNGRYDTVVNSIGILTRKAESNQEEAVYLNSYFPHFLSKITADTSTQIIQLSTDCVFSGRRGKYIESDFPDGELFYDRTKALGELVNKKDVCFRSSIVGPDIKKDGVGLMNWFLQQKEDVTGYKNAIWTGQTSLQMAKTIENAAIQRIHGLHHVVPQNSISKYDLLCQFNKYLRNKPIFIKPEYNFKIDKSLLRTRFELFSYQIPTYEEQIKELATWMDQHKALYSHYD